MRTDPLQLELPLPQRQPGSERQETLADRLCDLLIRRGRALEVGHVVAQVLRVRHCPEPLQRRLVAEIVDADQRLTWRGRDLVGLAPPGWADQLVKDATYCVVDLETTGGAPGRSRITEIGAVRVRGDGEIVERFTTLVNPGHPIPAPIIRITGIRDEMLVGQPQIDEVMDRFVDFVGDDVMVAHNAPFDLRFLNYERHRLHGRYFTQPWLDTLAIARRLLRGRVPRFDLGNLAAWANTDVEPNHRALPDAEATAQVLVRLLDLLRDRGITTLERAVGFGQNGGARYSHKLSLADNLPMAPGVYVMKDRSGAILYVGKARNLRRRVRSYFGPNGRHARRIVRALDSVARIDHEELPTELLALLAETELIRRHKPPCNTRGVRTAVRYLKLTINDALPRLFIVSERLEDGAAYFGPVRSERVARQAVSALHRIFPLHRRGAAADTAQQQLVPLSDHPQIGLGDARDAAEVVHALLSADAGDAPSLLMDALVQSPSAMLEFSSQEGRSELEALIGTLAAIGRVRAASRAVGIVVERTPAGVHTTLMAAGRVVATFDLESAQADERETAITSLIDTSLAGVSRGDEPVDEMLIIHDWLRARADKPGVVMLTAPVKRRAIVACLARLSDEFREGGAGGSLADAA